MVGLISLVFAFWISSLILSPLLSVTSGGAISFALSLRDTLDLFVAIVAVGSVLITIVTKNPYVLLGLLRTALLIVSGLDSPDDSSCVVADTLNSYDVDLITLLKEYRERIL